jgi:peptidoglycan/xylan/chitin deacetylase (PgdA/CDA1 family)
MRRSFVGWISLMAAVALLAAGGGAARSQAATTGPVVVTLGFDDGTVDQYDYGFPILADHGLNATFFVNTGPTDAGDPTHMTWAELHTMAAAGMEITGHTVDHPNLQPLSVADQEHEICDDRNALIANGFQPQDLAYPFGSWDSQVEAVTRYCGYNSGRTVSGVSKRSSGPFGETIPPADPYATRTPPNPKKATKLSTLELYVTNAENDTSQATDWVQYVFHKVCDKGTGGHCGAYAISRDKLSAFLDFLNGEITAGRVVVRTTQQVIGGPFNPTCHWDTGGSGCVGQAP